MESERDRLLRAYEVVKTAQLTPEQNAAFSVIFDAFADYMEEITCPTPVNANPLASNPVDDKIAPDTDGNAPAATDAGLVTVGVTGILPGSNGGFTQAVFRADDVPKNVELCIRSQAEELLAEERALAETATRQNALLWKRNEVLDAKLAAAEKALERLTLHANALALAHVLSIPADAGIWDALKDARAVLGGKPL
ncbi:hypothetical protein B3286c1_1764 [Brucella vulpis]|nr:hypothetical protein BF3285c1_1765 [Brucella vulpis]CUW50565.1 hypothetical protein B3286c1_1764 [Brucella vulpis]